MFAKCINLTAVSGLKLANIDRFHSTDKAITAPLLTVRLLRTNAVSTGHNYGYFKWL
jgi:hypothetical protein